MCGSECVDYSDYHPKDLRQRNMPILQSVNQSPRLSDNWPSHTSYLKKGDYMPAAENKNSDDDYDEYHIRQQDADHLSRNRNNFIVTEDEKQNLKMNCVALLEVDKVEGSAAASTEKPEPKRYHSNDTKTEKAGFINRVKNKFLSIFSSHPLSNKSDETPRNERSDFVYGESNQGDFEYFDYELPERKMFERSADSSTFPQDDLINLSKADVMYIKNFIKCFKENKKTFDIVPNTRNDAEKPTSTSKTPEFITQSCDVQTTHKSNAQTTIDHEGSSFPNSTGLEAKDEADTITVDLDINQKNGSGEDYQKIENDKRAQTHCTPLTYNTSQQQSLETKYFTKAKFLAHLPHEIERPSYKLLHLYSSKNENCNCNKPTVLMGDGKTTECAPLRLNEMSFDLDWKKDIKPTQLHPQKNRQEQSFADANVPENGDHRSIPYNQKPLNPPQKFPDDSDNPLKISIKRELPFKSFTYKRKSSENSALVPSMPAKDNFKRRTRLRGKSRSRTKPKHKLSNRARKSEAELTEKKFTEDINSYKSFDELNDIQFHVNSDDDEAITKFIANLNSPPELLSFDVDEYLRSTENENKLPAPKIKPQENEKYYKFADSLDKEINPLIETPIVKDDKKPLFEEHKITDKKRDLLRQYIKGVSNARLRDRPVSCARLANTNDNKLQGSPSNTNIPRSTKNIDNKYMRTEDLLSDYTNRNGDDEFLDNYYLLNDGSAQIFDLERQYLDEVESPKTNKVDNDLVENSLT